MKSRSRERLGRTRNESANAEGGGVDLSRAVGRARAVVSRAFAIVAAKTKQIGSDKLNKVARKSAVLAEHNPIKYSRWYLPQSGLFDVYL